jgi:hypothetical protein
VSEDILALLAMHREVLSVYVVTHFNLDDRPCGSLTVAVGGDCYRDDQVDFRGVLERTAQLAKAMERKSVINLPEIQVLHGGKKGEWILLDEQGHAIHEASEAARVALGGVIIQHGIEFLNRFKRIQLRSEVGEAARGLISMLPDSASPDTLSGKYWPVLCRAWRTMGLDMNAVTCVSGEAMGDQNAASEHSKIESALPTGYGVAATAEKLVEQLMSKPSADCEFLIEALGNVSFYTIHALINRHAVPPAQITAFDPNAQACDRARSAFPGVRIICMSDERFYAGNLACRYDVWINNGLGNRTTREQVKWLLNSGVRIFCGGANNFLRKKDEHASLEAIWNRGAWAWPDEAASGGGWTFAVMDLHARTLGNAVRAEDFIGRVIARVEKNNVNMIEGVMFGKSVPNGRQLWERIEQEINTRVAKDFSGKLSSREIVAAANVNAWQL